MKLLNSGFKRCDYRFFLIAGRGVFTKVKIPCGEFLLHYAGELISQTEAEQRELNSRSVFRIFFMWKGSSLW